jgi:hypothetical protein
MATGTTVRGTLGEFRQIWLAGVACCGGVSHFGPARAGAVCSTNANARDELQGLGTRDLTHTT